MGPILDYEKVLSDLSEKYGREVTFKEVFYDFDEGSKTFSARKVWQDPNNYPAMRIDFSTPKKPVYSTTKISRSVLYTK